MVNFRPNSISFNHVHGERCVPRSIAAWVVSERLARKTCRGAELHRDRRSERALISCMLAYVGPLASGDAPAVRTILRRLNVERIVVIPDGPKAWRFESNVDLAGLLGQDGGSRGPPKPPALGSAPAEPWRSSSWRCVHGEPRGVRCGQHPRSKVAPVFGLGHQGQPPVAACRAGSVLGARESRNGSDEATD
jgi:hypothetical protein